jgi:hypothetical protein
MKFYFCLGLAAAAPEVLERVWIQDEDAICNDGTPSAYYIKKSETGSDQWLVMLEGGGQCYDKDSCLERFKTSENLMSSKKYKDTISLSGVFDSDPEKSTMSSSNKVYLRYCTSDGHMGEKKRDEEIPFHFRGYKVVEAMIASL